MPLWLLFGVLGPVVRRDPQLRALDALQFEKAHHGRKFVPLRTGFLRLPIPQVDSEVQQVSSPDLLQ